MFHKPSRGRVCLLSLTVSFAAGVAAATATGPAPSEMLAAYSAPEIGPVFAVTGKTVEIGHLRLTMKDGYAARVLAGGEVIGLFFSGQGFLAYDSSNPDELDALRYNAKHAADLSFKEAETGEGARVDGKLDRMLLVGTASLLPDPDGDGAEPVVRQEDKDTGRIQDPAGDLADAFRKHLKVFAEDRSSPGAHFYLKHRLDRPDATVLRAELSGGVGNLCYLYDPIDARSEALYSLRRLRGSVPYGARWPVVVSEQPLDRDGRAFLQPLFLLTDVNYTLIADAKENARLTVTETIVPFGQNQRVFRFNLYNEFFDNQAKPREWRLTSVRDQQDRDLTFHHERDHLVVVFPTARKAGEPTRIRFEIEGRILYRPGNDAYWMLGVAPWFPQPGLGGQYYTVHSVVKVAKPFVPMTPGTTIARSEEGDYNVVESRIDKPVQFIVAMAGKYTIEEEIRDGITVRVASYAMPKKSAAKKLSNLAHKTIDYYQKFLGPFPFKEYNVIEINDLGWGQAPPGTMFITKEAFTPWFSQVWSHGINHRFAHEIAHQYWGHIVKMGSREEQWVTEAFAEYCSSFVVRQVRGKDGFRDLVADWQDNAKVANDKASIPYANRILSGEFNDYYDRKSLVYDKGALFLAALHDEIGDAAFASFLRSVQAGFEWRFASTMYMPDILERITKEDYTEMFEESFWGTKMPRTPKVLKSS